MKTDDRGLMTGWEAEILRTNRKLVWLVISLALSLALALSVIGGFVAAEASR